MPAKEVTKTNTKVKILVDGKTVKRTVYKVNGKKCIRKCVNGVTDYVSFDKKKKPTATKPAKKSSPKPKKKKQRGGDDALSNNAPNTMF